MSQQVGGRTNIIVFITVDGVFDFIDNLPCQRRSRYSFRSNSLPLYDYDLNRIYVERGVSWIEDKLDMHVLRYGSIVARLT